MPRWWGNITAFLGKDERGIMCIETISCQIPRHGREKAKANAQYAALAVNNLAALAEALRPLAELDLTGVKGDTVYQRDNTKIMVADVVAAREALKNIS